MYQVIIIKAKDCGACNQLDQNGTTKRVVDSLKSSGHQVKMINLESRASQHNGTTKWDRFINNNLRKWFPLFAVVDTTVIDNYNRGSVTDDVMKTKISVFNGKFDPTKGGLVMVKIYKYMNPEVVDEWISDFESQIVNSGSNKPLSANMPQTVVISDVPVSKSDKSGTMSCSGMRCKINPRY